MRRKELHEGIAGNGSKIWLVVTVDDSGAWVWIDRFDTLAEAQNWIKWA